MSVATKTKAGIQPGFLPPESAAAYLGRCRSWLDKKKQSGELPFYRLSGRSILFKVTDLDEYIQRFRVDPRKPSLAEATRRRRSPNGTFRKERNRKAKGIQE